MRKCQKDPTCSIFLKRGLFKDLKHYFPMCQTRKYKNTNLKYTNTTYDKMSKDPTCGIILKKKKDCSRISSESHTVVQGLVSTLIFPEYQVFMTLFCS